MQGVGSIVIERCAGYPGEEDRFSPDQRFPEYRHSRIAARPNPVYGAVRNCLARCQLDEGRLGSPEWNPLGRWIKPGNNVFILCNFVYHRRARETQEDFLAKCTHASLVRAAIDYVLIANQGKGRVWFGNAPLQSCRWDQVLRDTGAGMVQEFYQQQGKDVQARDLRMLVAERSGAGRTTRSSLRDEPSNCATVDLGADSLLEELYGSAAPRFRVSDYDPSRTEASHSDGRHRYVIHRDILNSDVIISIPKLKTHEKVGLTCNLKGFVGIVGQKDCLAHHRFGGPEIDGDEYPAGTHFRHALSRFHDWVQGRDRMAASFGALEVADRLVRRGLSCLGATQAGAWHGNDTAWRMAIDLARIASYADREGRMRETPQRGNLALVDGIIGGQGDGPLSPDPVRSGVVLFGDNVAAVDWAACRLIGFAPQAVPLVREAGRGMRYPLLGAQPGDWPVLFNGAETVAGRIPRVSARPFSAPRGWRGHIEEG